MFHKSNSMDEDKIYSSDQLRDLRPKQLTVTADVRARLEELHILKPWVRGSEQRREVTHQCKICDMKNETRKQKAQPHAEIFERSISWTFKGTRFFVCFFTMV